MFQKWYFARGFAARPGRYSYEGCREKGANSIIEVDLENQTITSSDGEVFSFEVDPFKKHCLLNGLDDIGLTMEKEDKITAYESKAAQVFTWA